MKKITIIGSGASGTLLAVNLIKNNNEQTLEINLVEKKDKIGRGIAYSTARDFHLLNVPANKMGAFADDIEHFHNWLSAKNYNFFSNDFVPRRLYGEYLRELFCETVNKKSPDVTVNVLDDEAVDILVDETKAQVILNSGEVLYSDKVVLAFGNFLPPHPKIPDKSFVLAEKYFQNPWSAEIPNKIEQTENVLIIGTGLTMIDTVLSLFHSGYKGKIFAVSKHGLLPAVHQLGFVYPSFSNEIRDKTKVSEILKIVREHVKKAKTQNSDWRGVIDSLRPITQEIWLKLPEAEKRRFMRHLRRVWDISRHRIPLECFEILEKMQINGQLLIKKGRVKNIEVTDTGKFQAICSSKAEETKISVDAIINCSGSESNFEKVDFPLVKNLIGKGYIKADSLKLGIEAHPCGKTIDQNEKSSEVLYTIGTALKGKLWESTAMPEIRAQAAQLATCLLN